MDQLGKLLSEAKDIQEKFNLKSDGEAKWQDEMVQKFALGKRTLKEIVTLAVIAKNKGDEEKLKSSLAREKKAAMQEDVIGSKIGIWSTMHAAFHSFQERAHNREPIE